jgi:hypothetical protein
MGQVVVSESVTLDGVMEDPANALLLTYHQGAAQ